MIGVDVPQTARIILLPAKGAGTDDILAKEKLCPVVDAMLDAYTGQPDAEMAEIKVIGHRWSAPSFEVRDFLARNAVPYRWLACDEPEGGRLLQANLLRHRAQGVQTQVGHGLVGLLDGFGVQFHPAGVGQLHKAAGGGRQALQVGRSQLRPHR